MSRIPRDQREQEEMIWPAAREQDRWAAPPPYASQSHGVPAWMDAPTDPNLRAAPKPARRTKSSPEWPGQGRPRPATGERLLRHAETSQFSVGCGSAAILLLIGACLLAALTTGIPFFGGSGSSPNGVQANPLATATTMPTATTTRVPTATSTLAPTATAAPTQAPASTPVPTITPAPSITPVPAVTPSPAATATPSPQPSPSATPTPRKHPTPTPAPNSTAQPTPTP